MVEKPLILVCHQSAELYGSDRSLLDLLIGIPRSDYELLVLLPESGPLSDELATHGIPYAICPLVKISRSMFTLRGLIKIPTMVKECLSEIDAIVGNKRVHVVYSNTLAILGGAIWAARRRMPHVWHVREIIKRPLVASVGLRALSAYLSKVVICNSASTENWLKSLPLISPAESHVIWNGVKTPPLAATEDERRQFKEKHGLPNDSSVITVVGRINGWKGQDLLVSAMDSIHPSIAQRVHVFFVGSTPPGQPEHLETLKASAMKSRYSKHFSFINFTKDIDEFYRGSDIVVVPSKEPEPFGRVAIEAMSHGVPIIAANHGGLSEIVGQSNAGILFEPNNSEKLAHAIEEMLSSTSLDNLRSAARTRQKEFFSVEAYCQAALKVISYAA